MAGAAQSTRLVASGWRASGAVHQSLYQPQRHAHLGICLRAAGRRAGQACFFAALVVCGSLADKGEFAEAAAQAKLQHWAEAYQEAQTRRY